jgi:membrane protein YqaA with SNARE-associated domain
MGRCARERSKRPVRKGAEQPVATALTARPFTIRTMEDGLMAALTALLHTLAIPEVGLGAVFVIAFVSATLLPMGSEPAVFGLVTLQPALFWPAIGVATLGNTLGGALTWWMGRGARLAADKMQHKGGTASQSGSSPAPAVTQGRAHQRAMLWLQRHGARACLLSWLPVVGDPLCAVAGWLRLPFWPCLVYMALGKLLRYVCMTTLLVSVS